MKTLNFWSKFSLYIKEGVKKSTIRKTNYQNIRVGESVILNSGQVKLQVKVIHVLDFKIKDNDIFLDGRPVENKARLAKNEGYSSYENFMLDLREYLNGETSGVYIQWKVSNQNN